MNPAEAGEFGTGIFPRSWSVVKFLEGVGTYLQVGTSITSTSGNLIPFFK